MQLNFVALVQPPAHHKMDHFVMENMTLEGIHEANQVDLFATLVLQQDHEVASYYILFSCLLQLSILHNAEFTCKQDKFYLNSAKATNSNANGTLRK